MKICLAQTKSTKGDIEQNISNHKRWIEVAVSQNVDLIVFSELSLTGYEPALAQELATEPADPRLNEFQQISDQNEIVIGVGLPLKLGVDIFISMLIFHPKEPRQVYSKQMLHSDELSYFAQGRKQTILTIKNIKIALAICYESLQPEHLERAMKLGAEVYLASVAKSSQGIEKAVAHFSEISKKHAIPVLMTNGIGPCDNFESAGLSAIWDENGTLIKQLDPNKECLLTYDTETKEVNKTYLPNLINSKYHD